ncbi:MAG: SpoIIE family protein phosphatase, partial [Actinomycetota bacterium]|nr:SpoIIE family protein phosphatase [Actinomycetota bacterium]
MDVSDAAGAADARATPALAVAAAALEALPQPVLVMAPVRDADGTVVDLVMELVNQAGARAAGLVAEEMQGRRLLEVLPAFPRVLFDGYVQTLRTGVPFHTELEYQDTFAGDRPVQGVFAVTATRLEDSVLVLYEDVTARVEAREREARFGALLDATSDWVSIADGDGDLVYVNPGGRRMVGLGSDEDLAGRRIGAFAPAWAREHVVNEVLPAVRREGVWRGDLARLHRDGHEIPVSQVIVARTRPGGEVDFYATIARDMTTERAAEAALRESEERFRIAFDQAPIGMALLDLAGRLVQVNDAYCRTVRRTREELLGLDPVQITHPDDVDFTRYAIDKMMTGETPVFRFDKRYVDPEGEVVWVEVSGSLFRDAEGRPQFVIGQVQDLGERRVARTLQRSMLTTRLPRVDGVDVAVRYLPSSPDAEVSGDWYDLIRLPHGRVGIVIGDVVGRGVEAAASMSQLRTALRAYAVEGLAPAEVVGKLHRLVHHLDEGMSTTLAYLDLDPLTRQLRYVSAGHLPPLVVTASGAARYLTGARTTPLGVAAADARVTEEHEVLQPGDTVLLYTDGLVERREESLDRGLAVLQDAMATAPADLDGCLEHLTARLADERRRPDDVALMAIRTLAPSADPFAMSLTTGHELALMRAGLRGWLAGAGAGAEETG